MRFTKIKSRPDLYATLVVFTLMIVFQVIAIIVKEDFNYLFGVEYGNIATSMLSGNGFSNPFYPVETGSTAWVTPMLVYVIYGAFLVFGISVKAFVFLSILKFASYALTFYILLKVLEQVKIKINYFILVVIYLLYFLFSPSDNLNSIHDFWLVQLFVSIFLFSLLKVYYDNTKYMILLSITIFVTPFANSILALAFLIVSGLVIFIIPLFSIIKTNGLKGIVINSKSKFVRVFALSLVFGLSVSIWSVRNYIVFDKFIPTKSNMWFEFYMSNIVDSDGQLSWGTLVREHPFLIAELRVEIRMQGEVNWMESYHAKGLSYLKNNTSDYFNKVANRLFNACIFIENDDDRMSSANYHLFSDSDKLELNQNRLFHKNEWTVLCYSENDILNIIEQSKIEDKELVFKDWEMARLKYIQRKYSIPNIVRGLFMAGVPSICIFLLLFFRKIRRNPLFFVTVTMYILYLIPYVLISHQIRYQRPLFLLQVVLVYLFTITLYEKIKVKYVIERKVKKLDS